MPQTYMHLSYNFYRDLLTTYMYIRICIHATRNGIATLNNRISVDDSNRIALSILLKCKAALMNVRNVTYPQTYGIR